MVGRSAKMVAADRARLAGREGVHRGPPAARVARAPSDQEPIAAFRAIRTPARGASAREPRPLMHSSCNERRWPGSIHVGPSRGALAARRVDDPRSCGRQGASGPFRFWGTTSVMGTSDPRNAATKLGVDRHEAPAADMATLSPDASGARCGPRAKGHDSRARCSSIRLRPRSPARPRCRHRRSRATRSSTNGAHALVVR